jgi:hypothetical protein
MATMGKKKLSPLELTAYHEAGHVYMHIHTGTKFREAVLYEAEDAPEDAPEGLVEADKIRILEALVILHAGYIAVDIACGRKRPGRSFLSLFAAATDFETAKKRFEKFCLSEREIMLLRKWIEEHVWNVLNLHWVVVMGIAFELQRKKRLTYRQVLALIRTLT